jgi:hypothetical protein
MWAAAVGATFNLICSGMLLTTDFRGKRSEAYSDTYRLDLGARKYCESECKAQFDIARVDPTELTLDQKGDAMTRGSEYLVNRVDRETGAHSAFASSGRGSSTVMLTWTGVCKVAPFTGFPTFKTKF